MRVKETTRFIDLDTGEVVKTESIVMSGPKSEPPFVKLYLDDDTFDNFKLSHLKLAARLINAAGYNGIVIVDKDLKKKLEEQLGYKGLVLRNRLYELCKTGILSKHGCSLGQYRINPFLFGKGRWKSIHEQQQAFSLGHQDGETG